MTVKNFPQSRISRFFLDEEGDGSDLSDCVEFSRKQYNLTLCKMNDEGSFGF